MIECYNTFNYKGCPDEPIFGEFHDQPIHPGYYYFLNDNDDNDNNNTGTTVDDVFLDNEGVKYEVVPNATDANDNDE